MVKIKFAKVKDNAIIPSKNLEDAGYDIYTNFDNDFLIIDSLETLMIPTGIASALPDTHYFQIQERGSTGTKAMKYGAGVIDSGYRGEWFIPITNCSNRTIVIKKESKSVYDFVLNEVKKSANAINEVYEAIYSVVFIKKLIDEEVYLDEDEKIVNSGTQMGDDIAKKITDIIFSDEEEMESINNILFYPYEKAIAQAVLLEVPVTEIEEISYEDLQKIDSKRGTGALGSSNK